MSSKTATATSAVLVEEKKRYLFEKSDFPDNHVDRNTFLTSLVTNADVRTYTYWTVVRNTIPVTQQISAVTIFLAIFSFALGGVLSESFLGCIDITIAILGAFMANVPKMTETLSFDTARSVYLLGGTLVVLAPVMRTLTESYSTDTVTFLVMLLCAFHLVFHEYRITSSTSGTSMFSLNAGIFASVLLASRLSSDILVFEILALGTELLVCFPLLRQSLMKEAPEQNIFLGCVMILMAFSMLLALSSIVAAAYLAGIAIILLVCPMGLIYIQKYKYRINGPWDIASVKKEAD